MNALSNNYSFRVLRLWVLRLRDLRISFALHETVNLVFIASTRGCLESRRKFAVSDGRKSRRRGLRGHSEFAAADDIKWVDLVGCFHGIRRTIESMLVYAEGFEISFIDTRFFFKNFPRGR